MTLPRPGIDGYVIRLFCTNMMQSRLIAALIMQASETHDALQSTVHSGEESNHKIKHENHLSTEPHSAL